ncbi:PEP-CTERM sorting domain-containing protein [Sphingomonas tabacisoli]|uniref:PEP-CTERM sorting domain-containing protein n=1 Tax=Sphingomonas tabacisoli TaxID=2249466 RepID=A0ABW4HYH6_9SPHN
MKKMVMGAVLAAGLAMPAQAWVSVYVETSPTTQAMIAAGGRVENFSDATRDDFRSSFGGSNVGAAFTGFKLASADAGNNRFGGSAYVFTTDQASVKLDRGVQYLSFRTEALDGKNTIELFSKGASLGTWSLVDSAAKAGFKNDPSAYSSAYTYVNFFTDMSIDEVHFRQSSGRFAMDDFTIGRVTAVPEAQTWTLLILGFGGMGTALRWKRRRAVAA